MSKPKAAAKPMPKPAGSDLVALNLRLSRDLIAALDEVLEQRRRADPFTPLTRTDLVRESLVRTITEARAKGEAL